MSHPQIIFWRFHGNFIVLRTKKHRTQIILKKSAYDEKCLFRVHLADACNTVCTHYLFIQGRHVGCLAKCLVHNPESYPLTSHLALISATLLSLEWPIRSVSKGSLCAHSRDHGVSCEHSSLPVAHLKCMRFLCKHQLRVATVDRVPSQISHNELTHCVPTISVTKYILN